MDRIKAQADTLWKILSEPKTYATYKDAVLITWIILVEAALLVWLVICLGLVVFEWFWNSSIVAGRNFRDWFNNRIEGPSDQIASETGRALLSASKNGLDFTIAAAKSQLGMPVEEKKEAK
ncbi:MAG: hypothetical protein HC866_24235 [Leptolyngbyaceae cyanobacterium RU_5_1]|nr:hypothetical protein [Leptolyngbyaceae cyanobacterium RU_5_1]